MLEIIEQNSQSIQTYSSETGVVSDIHPDDLIFSFLIENACFPTLDHAIKYYFHDGKKSAEKLSNLLFNELKLPKKWDTSILEFASGYGCVTRHLVKELAPIKVTSCDIHQAACSFIDNKIGIQSVLSASKPEDLNVESESYNAVFALSFFSHMPEQTWGRWLKSLYSKVKQDGYLIFTTQGKTSAQYFGNPKIPETGIWFSPSSEQKDLDVAEYGSTLVTPEFVHRTVKAIINEDVLMTVEAGWWEHQDLYVIKKSHAS